MAESTQVLIEDDDPPEEEEVQGGDPLWLITFGDCISLLLTFFVLLISFTTFEDPSQSKNIIPFESAISTGANIGGKKFERIEIDHEDTQIQKMLESGSGSLNFGEEVIADENLQTEQMNDIFFTLGQVQEFMEAKKQNAQQPVPEVKPEIQFTFTFDPGIYFYEGQPTLQTDAYPLLEKISTLLAQIPNDIILTGYTDKIIDQSKDKKDAEFDLSIQRAVEAAAYLIDISGIDPARISISAKAAQPPKGPLNKITLSITGSLDGYTTTLRRQSSLNKNKLPA